MADELDGLLARVDDPALRADLRAHIDRIRAKRTFGLVFESHLPERVRLPEHPVRTGAKVALRDDPDSATYRVLRVHDGEATVRTARHPDGSRLSAEEEAEADDEIRPVADLVVIADFGEAVDPGLRTLGSIDRGGDKPAHVVIKGGNHHVLEALRFTPGDSVDVDLGTDLPSDQQLRALRAPTVGPRNHTGGPLHPRRQGRLQLHRPVLQHGRPLLELRQPLRRRRRRRVSPKRDRGPYPLNVSAPPAAKSPYRLAGPHVGLPHFSP